MKSLAHTKNFASVAKQIKAEASSKVFAGLKRSNYLLDDHSPIRPEDEARMLSELGVADLEQLTSEVMVGDIRQEAPIDSLDKPIPVDMLLERLKKTMKKNQLNKSYIGAGFYGTLVPHVIERNFLSNPGWYTAYTPYQAEISQGRLEGIMVFQELCRKLTNFEIAGASLLDEASAASEAMLMGYNSTRGKLKKCFVDENVFEASINVMQTNAEFLGIELVITNVKELDAKDVKKACSVVVQSPNKLGEYIDWTEDVERLKSGNKKLTFSVGTDLAALMMFKSPGEMGADVAFGYSQRFGVPMGYGGPAAAFFCTHKNNIRKLPGRIIGVSKDSSGQQALRMALQTREQHIRREKATSNICTAQALLANMAAFYSVYHGESGLQANSERIHLQTQMLKQALEKLGFELVGGGESFFDTLAFKDGDSAIFDHFLQNGINLRKVDSSTTAVSLDETTSVQDLRDLIKCFAGVAPNTGEDPKKLIKSLETEERAVSLNPSILREEYVSEDAKILEHPVFHSIKGEHEMMRYLKYLENLDISLTKSMISLGSCTMKLNAATEMIPLTWPELNIHPYVPAPQAAGYSEMIDELRSDLSTITGMDHVCFNPNSGASGEYSGLLAIRTYQKSIGEGHRDVCLDPCFRSWHQSCLCYSCRAQGGDCEIGP